MDNTYNILYNINLNILEIIDPEDILDKIYFLDYRVPTSDDIKSYNKNTPSWETCLENFDNSVLDNDLIKHNCLGYFVSHRAHTINQVRLVLEDLQLTSAHLYMNITAHGGSNGNHVDQDDVYFGKHKAELDGNLTAGMSTC